MHPALETFLKEYKYLLSETKKGCVTVEEKFAEIKQQLETSESPNDLLSELYHINRSLFQTNYFLMERHTTVKNLYWNYSEDDQKVIDEYDDVFEKATLTTNKISKYIDSKNKNTQQDNSLNA